jgi:hypothetical protein
MMENLKQNKELWSLFTAGEEYNHQIVDQYGRFPYYLSKNREILEPKVSKFLVKNGFNIEYLEGKNFAVFLTHDIDGVYFPMLDALRSGTELLTQHQIINALKNFFSLVNRKWNPGWNFKEIIRLEEKYSAKSSFYFLSLDINDLGFNYRVEELKNELKNITEKGWEIGLHGSDNAYNNLDRVKKEKTRLEKILGKKVIGYRSHNLRFTVPDTWELLNKAGFRYDTTFGYADCVGFRNGMCHPFKPFNLNTNKEINILEFPLTIMDTTLFDRYMKLDLKNAWKITKKLIDTTKKYNGVLTILWHNGSFMNNNYLLFYEKILKYCYEKKAWMTSAEEIWKFYDKYLNGLC